jgi:hypothetical protein
MDGYKFIFVTILGKSATMCPNPSLEENGDQANDEIQDSVEPQIDLEDNDYMTPPRDGGGHSDILDE